jgi:hypothetical protein
LVGHLAGEFEGIVGDEDRIVIARAAVSRSGLFCSRSRGSVPDLNSRVATMRLPNFLTEFSKAFVMARRLAAAHATPARRAICAPREVA